MPVLRSALIVLLAALIALPVSAAQPSMEATSIEIDGFPLAISPDGTRLAGVDADGARFCVWDRATGEAPCDGDLPAPVEARSVTWAPDGSAVAFSLGSSNRLVDSDIYLFDVASGMLRNLTDDSGADSVSFLVPQVTPVAIDVFPAWSPDGTSLLFARTMWGDAGAPGVTLMTIPREGGEPKTLRGAGRRCAACRRRPDGTGARTAASCSRRAIPTRPTPSNAIRLIDANGDVSTLVDGSASGAIPDPVLASISDDGAVASVWSRLDFNEGLWAADTPVFFRLDIASGALTPWTDVPGVGLPDGARLLAPPVIGPDGAVAFLWRVKGGEMGISVLDASGAFNTVSSVTYTPSGGTSRNVNGLTPTLQWAGDGSLLLLLPTGGAIIPLTSAEATPAG